MPFAFIFYMFCAYIFKMCFAFILLTCFAFMYNLPCLTLSLWNRPMSKRPMSNRPMTLSNRPLWAIVLSCNRLRTLFFCISLSLGRSQSSSLLRLSGDWNHKSNSLNSRTIRDAAYNNIGTTFHPRRHRFHLVLNHIRITREKIQITNGYKCDVGPSAFSNCPLRLRWLM